MASKRHGKVTRWVTSTRYQVTLLTVAGKRSEEKTDYDGLTPTELEAAERLHLNSQNAVLLDFKVIERKKELYGEPVAQFIKHAILLETAQPD